MNGYDSVGPVRTQPENGENLDALMACNITVSTEKSCVLGEEELKDAALPVMGSYWWSTQKVIFAGSSRLLQIRCTDIITRKKQPNPKAAIL